MLNFFFDSKGVIHHKYVPEGRTVNVTFHVQVLDCLCKCIALMRPEMWRDRKFFLFHDNARPHTAAIIQQFLDKKGVAQLSHPRLFRFPRIKIGGEWRPFSFDRRHSEICNYKIKSVSNFWLCTKYETAPRSCQRVYSSVRILFWINITYFNFLLFFQYFCSCCKTYWAHLVF